MKDNVDNATHLFNHFALQEAGVYYSREADTSSSKDSSDQSSDKSSSGKDSSTNHHISSTDRCLKVNSDDNNSADSEETAGAICTCSKCSNALKADNNTAASNNEIKRRIPMRNVGYSLSGKPYTGVLKWLDDAFVVSRRGSSFRREIVAGLITFLAMAYILVVNPDILLSGDRTRWAAVFIATVFGAAFGTILMAFLAKLPYAQAPGMGLNSVAGGLIGGYGAYQYNFNTAMLIILISGVIFMLLSIIPGRRDPKTGKLRALREEVFYGVPKSIRAAIPVGIGFFVAFIGFQNANIVNASEHTLTHFVVLSDWGRPEIVKNALICFFGLITIAILNANKVKGSVILGILASTVLAMILGAVDLSVLKGNGDVSWKFWENFEKYFSTSEEGAFFTPFFDIKLDNGVWHFIMMVLTFTMVDTFDTMGSVIGCATHAKLVDDDGKPVGYSDIIHADSIATVVGAMLGTSTVTTYVESGEGIDAGGRTGVTAIVVAIMFLLAVFFAPIFAFIPPAATAPALIYVGLHMIGSLRKIDFHDVKNGVPAFFAIIIMPLSYSITDGIGVSILSFVLINAICYFISLIKSLTSNTPKPKWNISAVTLIIAVLFLIFFFTPVG